MTSENIGAIRDAVIAVAMLVAAVVLASIGDREHAGMVIAGLLGMIAPMAARMRQVPHALPLAAGIAAAVALSGCTAAQLAQAGTVGHAVARVTCGGAAKLSDACRALGLGPDDPCPAAASLAAPTTTEE